MLFKCDLHIYFHMMVLVLKLSEHLLREMQTEHMQWGPLVEIRGSISPIMVVVVTNNPFNCYCWAITLMNHSKHSKGFLQYIYFFHVTSTHQCSLSSTLKKGQAANGLK